MEPNTESSGVTKCNNNAKEEEFFEIQIQDEWLNSTEAAAFLKISKADLYNLCSSGKIKYAKLGRRSRFRRED